MKIFAFAVFLSFLITPVLAQETTNAPAPTQITITPVDTATEVTGALALVYSLADCAAMYSATAQLQVELLKQTAEAKKVQDFADLNKKAAVFYAHDVEGIDDPEKYVTDRVNSMIYGYKLSINSQSEQASAEINEQTKKCQDIDNFRMAAFKQPEAAAPAQPVSEDAPALPPVTVTEKP